MIFGELSTCSGGGCEGRCLPAEVGKAHGADLASRAGSWQVPQDDRRAGELLWRVRTGRSAHAICAARQSTGPSR